MKRRIFTIMLAFMLVGGIQVTEARANILTKLFDQTGYFNWDVKGKGMIGQTSPASASVDIDLDGNPIYGVTTWHGFGSRYWTGAVETGNPNATFNGNGITGTALSETAGGDYGVGYHANVTSHLASGNQNYTIGGVNFNGPTNGFNVTAVHKDVTKSNYGQLKIFAGNDYFHTRFNGNNGPDSGVLDFIVKPVDYDRTATVALSYAGAQGCAKCGPDAEEGRFSVFEDRRSYLWYYLSQGGATPGNLVDEAFATEHPDPHVAYARDGLDWDTYWFDLLLPANTSKVALQTHSDDEIWLGVSASLVGVTAFIPERTHAVPEPASMMLFGAGLAGAAIRRKFSA